MDIYSRITSAVAEHSTSDIVVFCCTVLTAIYGAKAAWHWHTSAIVKIPRRPQRAVEKALRRQGMFNKNAAEAAFYAAVFQIAGVVLGAVPGIIYSLSLPIFVLAVTLFFGFRSAVLRFVRIEIMRHLADHFRRPIEHE